MFRRRMPWAYHDAFVFSGGGNGGAAQVGMVRALLEAGIVPDVVVGCSVGALNAAFMAVSPTLDRATELEDVWRFVGRGMVFSGTRRTVARNVIRRQDHLYEPDGLRALIGGSLGLADLGDGEIPIHVVTTDLGTGAPAWWTGGDPVDILSASACLPGVFPPVRLGDSLHVDGGVLDPVPVARAVALGAQRVWVLDVCSSRPPRLPDRPSALDVLLNSFALARRALRSEVDLRPGQELICFAADLPELDVRDFSQTAAMFDIGRSCVTSSLASAVAC